MTDTHHRATEHCTGTSGVVETIVHDAPQDHIDDWGDLSRSERFVALQAPIDIDPRTVAEQTGLTEARVRELARIDPPPATTERTTNTTLEAWSTLLAKVSNPNESVGDTTVGGIELGDGGSGGTDPSNTELNNKVGEIQLSVVQTAANAPDTRDLVINAYLDTTELNGNTLDELMTVTDLSASHTPVNHATFSSITKNDQKAVTFSVTIQYRAQ